MEKINYFIDTFSEALEGLDYDREPKNLYAPIGYTLALGGKKIRPALLLLSNDLFGGKIDEAMNAALAIEVFHNFTLVHDDIMDDAPLRRGKPTVFKKWNANTAILSGDVMMVNAYQLLAKTNVNLAEVISIFNRTAVEVCEGQQYDMDFETRLDVSIDDYLRMIELKTAVLLGASMQIGAVIADTDKSNSDHLYAFGKNLGVAFQLMDDILDLYGNPDKFGKQIGGDIISNKKTYLLLKAKELAKGELAKELDFCLNSTVLKPDLKVARVKKIFDQLKIKELAIDEMNLYYNTALSHLDTIEAPQEGKEVFENFAKSLMNRES